MFGTILHFVSAGRNVTGLLPFGSTVGFGFPKGYKVVSVTSPLSLPFVFQALGDIFKLLVALLTWPLAFDQCCRTVFHCQARPRKPASYNLDRYGLAVCGTWDHREAHQKLVQPASP